MALALVLGALLAAVGCSSMESGSSEGTENSAAPVLTATLYLEDVKRVLGRIDASRRIDTGDPEVFTPDFTVLWQGKPLSADDPKFEPSLRSWFNYVSVPINGGSVDAVGAGETEIEGNVLIVTYPRPNIPPAKNPGYVYRVTFVPSGDDFLIESLDVK